MRLQKVKLSGFKSFSEQAIFELAGQLNGIVGPNGCGKSNIIDAVKWVMGESSAKQLRGESMTDVIFNGSQKRPPASEASIELIFDNQLGVLKGALATFTEISVKRVLTREGGNQYYLNQVRCRRKDIVDLFLGTGLGARSYAIIEQGMVARIVESRAEDLRVFFEEAANISKYKERRRETAMRIAHTRENLVRLTDIYDEIQKQYEKIAKQAQAADQFVALQRQLRKTKWQYWQIKKMLLADQYSQLEDNQQSVTNQLIELSEQEQQQKRALQIHQQQLEALQSQQQSHDQDYQQKHTQWVRLTEQIQHQQVLLNRQSEDLGQLQETLERLKKALVENEAAQQSWQIQLDDVSEQLEFSEETLRQKEQCYRDAQQQLHTIQQIERTVQVEVNEQEKELERLKISLQHQETQQWQLQQHINHQDDNLQNLQDTEAFVILETAKIKLETNEARLASLQVAKADQEAAWQNAIEEYALKKQQGIGLEGTLQKYQAQLSALKLLQQQTAVSNSKEVTHPLYQNIEVEKDWQFAAEKVLGDYLYLAVRQSDDIAVVDNGSYIEGFCHYNFDQAELGYYVKSHISLASLLYGVKIAPNETIAMANRSSLALGEYFVTPTGTKIGSDWVCYASLTENSVLAREAEIHQLEMQIALVEEERELINQTLEDQQKILDELEQSVKHHIALVQDTQQHCFQLEKEYSLLEQMTQQKERQYQETLAKQATEQQQLLALSDEIKSIRKTLTEQLAQWELQQERLSQCQEEKEQWSQQVQNDENAWRQAVQALLPLKQQQESIATHLHHADKQQHTLHEQYLTTEQQLVALTTESVLHTRLVEQQQEAENIQQMLEILKETQQQLHEEKQALMFAQATTQEYLDDCRAQTERLRQTVQQLTVQTVNYEHETAQIDSALSELQIALAADGVSTQVPLDLADISQHTALLLELEETSKRLQQKIDRLGVVNLLAIEEAKTLRERKNYLEHQQQDLLSALTELEAAIAQIDQETKGRFESTFNAINEEFTRLFPKLFGGGEAFLRLTEDDILSSGVAIIAKPPGKKPGTIHLLSGGEKALTAMALIFAIFNLNPAPFCMLDEVDAPLDETNVLRFGHLLREMSQRVQLIFITHNKHTMAIADYLIGVTMQEAGVSRLVSVDLAAATQMVDE